MARQRLTPQQRLFAHEYLVDSNATRAAIRAGYPPRSAYKRGSDLLKNSQIRKLVAAGTRKLTERTGITVERAVLELRRILTVDVAGAFDETGCLKPLSEIPEDVRRAISGLEVEEVQQECEDDDGETETIKVGRVVKMKFWSKTDASQQLLRKLGAFRDSTVDRLAQSLEDLIAAKVSKPHDDGDEE